MKENKVIIYSHDSGIEIELSKPVLIQTILNQSLEETFLHKIWEIIKKDFLEMVLLRANISFEWKGEILEFKGHYNTYQVNIYTGEAKIKGQYKKLCIMRENSENFIYDPILTQVYKIPYLKLSKQEAFILSTIYTLIYDNILSDKVLKEQII